MELNFQLVYYYYLIYNIYNINYLIVFNYFKDSFISNLLRIIQHMQPKTNKQSGKISNDYNDKSETLASKFPGLAIPNKIASEVNDPIEDVMAELESFAPIFNSKYGFIIDSFND